MATMEQLLATLETPEQEKVASEIPKADAPLKNALETALKGTEKKAEEKNPVNDLLKVAAELAEQEKTAEIQQAALCGAAFADAQIQRYAAYDAQLKMAAAQGYDAANAAVDPQEKLAADYAAGGETALQEIQTATMKEFLKGAAEIEVFLNLVVKE